MNYVVRNPAGLYLQDQGMHPSVDFPRGAPGHFGPRETAYVFVGRGSAEIASGGLLGAGRRSTVEEA